MNLPNFIMKIFRKQLFFIIFVLMQVQTKAIVLRSVRYGDSQIIVDMLTELHGRLSFAVTVAKTRKGKMKKQLFQPLSMLVIAFDFRPNKQLQRLSDIRILCPFTTIVTDPYKLSVALFLTEFLSYATRNEQHNSTLFNYIAYSVEWLDNECGNIANFHIVFMLRLTLFLGIYPNMESYTPGAWFDLRDGVFTATNPMHPDVVEPADAIRLLSLIRLNFRSMHLFAMSREERSRCLHTILHYYRLHIPAFLELKSLDILGELFV